MTRPDSWHLGEGDPITPELTAMRLLGGGSAYEAYLAFDDITFAPVVVKLLRPDQVDDERSLRGLEREVRLLATANHPVVVRGLRHVLDGDRPHVVLENIDGPRLSSLIRRYGRLSEQQYLPLAIDIASALHYFRHARRVPPRHQAEQRDHGRARAPDRPVRGPTRRPGGLADLGRSAPTSTCHPSRRLPGERGEPGHASDVWGLGATLFHAVAGYRPFDEGAADDDDAQVRFPQLVDEPYTLPDGVPEPVAKVLYATLRRDPSRPPAAARDRRRPRAGAQRAAGREAELQGQGLLHPRPPGGAAPSLSE